jgi:NAD(P)-dependent dehydrogenase (short-subunit alcohol dehydrogenase family)
MTQGTCIITGANSGLGLETAKYLAKNNPEIHIVLACRNESTAKSAVSSIKNAHPKASLEYLALDLGSLESIRAFGNLIKQKRESGNIPPITSILFNAATVHHSDSYTKDGFESTFGCNHLGHFLLTHLLLRLVDPDYPTRIVFVSSGVHDEREGTNIPKPNFKMSVESMAHPEKDTRDGRTVGGERYSTSKLCNILTTYELVKRMKQVESLRNVTVNAMCPGLMLGTGLARNAGWLFNFIHVYILPWLSPIFSYFMGAERVATPDESGKYLATLATSDKFDGVTGKYVRKLKCIESSLESYDEQKQRVLWEESIKLVGLKQDETVFTL